MKITIDGKSVEIYETDQNIVEVADREKIALPAPCYRNNRQKGCCQVCLIEIDHEKKYACVTKPANGMTIIIDRPDLNEIRKENAKKYESAPDIEKSDCTCNCSCTTTNCC